MQTNEEEFTSFAGDGVIFGRQCGASPQASSEFARSAPRTQSHTWPGMLHELHNDEGRDSVLACMSAWTSSPLSDSTSDTN